MIIVRLFAMRRASAWMFSAGMPQIGGPLRRLRRVVVGAREVALEAIKADRVLVEKLPIEEFFGV